LSEEYINTLWRKYKTHNDTASQQELIVEYAPLVKYVAGRVAISLPPTVELDDLISYGIFGLIDSIERFDPDRGVKFETYAIVRIRGAIIDGLRSFDWVPRSVRTKAKRLEEAYSQLERQLNRTPTDEELSESLNMTIQQFHDALQEVSATTLTSLDDLWFSEGGGEDSLRVMDTVEDRRSVDPITEVEMEEKKLLLAKAIDQLGERERLVITLYYYEGLTLKEIGAVLGVSESRICQIHGQAIIHLRSRLNPHRTAMVD
jgi:RNA polymerase sigma factor for flagellar operon FliA